MSKYLLIVLGHKEEKKHHPEGENVRRTLYKLYKMKRKQQKGGKKLLNQVKLHVLDDSVVQRKVGTRVDFQSSGSQLYSRYYHCSLGCISCTT